MKDKLQCKSDFLREVARPCDVQSLPDAEAIEPLVSSDFLQEKSPFQTNIRKSDDLSPTPPSYSFCHHQHHFKEKK